MQVNIHKHRCSKWGTFAASRAAGTDDRWSYSQTHQVMQWVCETTWRLQSFCCKVIQQLKDAGKKKKKKQMLTVICFRVEKWQTNDWVRGRMRQMMASAGLRGAVELSETLYQPAFLAHSFLKSSLTLSPSCGMISVLLVLEWNPSTCTSRQRYIKCTEPWQYFEINGHILSLTLLHTSFSLNHLFLLAFIYL